MREVPAIFCAAVFFAAVVLAAGCFYGWWRNRKMYRTIDRMLDEILDGEPVSQSDIREGEISVLASKAKRVKEKVDLGISTAEEEKEQVKSLISNMSHQLKTPLAGLMMYREMLEDENLDEETRKRFLGKMKGQSEKIDWILQSLFKMVNLEQGAVVFEAEALPVRDTILDAVTAVLDRADRRNIRILTEPFEDRLLWHNRKWTAEVLVNLLENAVKYTEPGGRITISVCPMEMYTEIAVRDTGRGIRQEELTEIFKRFYRSRDVENIEGSGIGLYLSRLILEHEKGYMTAESELGDHMQVFVSPDLDYGMNGSFLYLKFDESSPVFGQIKAFAEQYGVDGSTVARNNGMAGYVGAEETKLSADQIRTALTDPAMGLPWIWGSLNENEALTEGAVLLVLALFAAFIIYSIFQVSVFRRLSQYSVMQTLGMTDGSAFGMLMAELALILVGGYTAGVLLGNGAAALIYRKVGRIFITRNQVGENVARHTGVSSEETAAELSVSALPDAGVFHVDFRIIWMGALFLILVLALISIVLVRRMRQLTLREMIAKDPAGRKKNRKIYSLRHENLTGILAKKFMFSRKGTFIGILLSLSVGSVIFLGAAYVTENTRINNELTFAADDGLGSDIQVYEASDSLKDTIPEKTVEELKGLSGLENVFPVRYMLGEIPLYDGILKGTSFFAETAGEEGLDPDPEIMEKYNGQIVQTGEDDYRLKVNIYGYDDEMLESLNDYVLEGSIDPDQMRKENTVLFKTLMDGQGNYDVIDIGAGDTVQIRTPEDPEAEGETLKFLSGEEDYRDRSLKIGALISRPLAKVETYIGDDGVSNVDIIMTNEQMEENFGVTGYRTISISLPENADGEDAARAADEIRDTVSGIRRCAVKDYTAQIEAQDLYLNQQIMFFYGIAAVLLLISLLHIMNSMQYLVAERRYEFSVLRAMGITDAGFLRMLMKEGVRYGIYSSIVMLVLYWIVQKVLYYFMVHVYLYLHPQGMISAGYLIFMVMLNVALCTGAMALSGRRQPAEARPAE